MVAATVTRLCVECSRDGTPMLSVGLQIPLSILIPAVAEFQRSLSLPVAPFGGSDCEVNAGDSLAKDAALNITFGGVIGGGGLTAAAATSSRAPAGLAGPEIRAPAFSEHKSKSSKPSKPKPRVHELASAGKAEELQEALGQSPEMLNLAVGDNGVTPLLLAALKGRTDAVKVLLDARADVDKAGLDKTPGDGASAAFWCAHKGHTDTLARLIEARADISKTNGHGATPVFAAAQKGCTAALKLLLEARADADTAREDGATPALIAASEGHAELLHLLIQHRADLNQCSYDGVTPLCIATQKNYLNSAKALLDASADINKATIHGATPVYIAAWMGHTEILQELIRAGANFDKARSDDGTSPIFIAILEGHAEAVYVLATARADLHSTPKGRTPLQEAIKRGRENVAAVLSCAMGLQGLSLPAGEDPQTAVATAIRMYRSRTSGEEWPLPGNPPAMDPPGAQEMTRVIQPPGFVRQAGHHVSLAATSMHARYQL